MVNAKALVFVIDDNAVMRSSISGQLRCAGHAVEMFSSAREFLARSIHSGPACLVVDLDLSEMNGLQLQQVLLENQRHEQVIFVVDRCNILTCVEAMKAGAIDYLPNPVADKALLRAVNTGLERSFKLCHKRLRQNMVCSRLSTLTRRQREVFQLMIQGMTNREMAEVLGAAEATIKIHRKQTMEKMKAKSLPDLVLLAQSAGLAASFG